MLLPGDESRLTVALVTAVTFGLVVRRLAIVAGDQREQRRRAGSDGVPMLLVGSLGERDHRPEASEFSAILTKPVKPSALYDALASSMVDRQRPPVALSVLEKSSGTGGTRWLMASRHWTQCLVSATTWC